MSLLTPPQRRVMCRRLKHGPALKQDELIEYVKKVYREVTGRELVEAVEEFRGGVESEAISGDS